MPRDLFTQPLFSPKLIRTRFPAQAVPESHIALVTEWVDSLKGGLAREKEESIRPAFLQRFFVDLLGYQLMGGMVWTLHHEKGTLAGSADAALGTFTHEQRQVLAPFELKGPKTSNLDALMPGRHKSPVQQAWEYAMDLPGSQFVLVSNCAEVRLYALGYRIAQLQSDLVLSRWHLRSATRGRMAAAHVHSAHRDPAHSPCHARAASRLSALALAAAQTAQERLKTQRDFARRITDLLRNPLPMGAQTSLGDKLSHWWLSPDFKSFQQEVVKRFKADIGLRERNDWQALFEQEKTRVQQLGANIAAVERRIDQMVYTLFGLSPAEVALLERSLGC